MSWDRLRDLQERLGSIPQGASVAGPRAKARVASILSEFRGPGYSFQLSVRENGVEKSLEVVVNST